MKKSFNVSFRHQFPFLKRKFPTSSRKTGLRGRGPAEPVAYLDNASTTQKPKVVIDALADVYTNHYANIHRGVYDLSLEATDLYEGVRQKVAKFTGAKSSSEIIFTRNTTEAINLVARSLGDWDSGNFLKDGEILLTEMEHHSNIVPWQMLAARANKKQEKIKYIAIDNQGRLDLSSLDKLVSKKTRILSLTLMSNVLGTINPVSQIIKRAKKICPGLIAVCDAAQAAAHMEINVEKLGCDFLAFSAHKMYGPAGVGVLWGKRDLLEKMPPFMGGGDMILEVDFQKTIFNEVPYKFEAGTPAIADVIAFEKAIEFIESIGFSQIIKHDRNLASYALNKLRNDSYIELYGTDVYADRGPVIAFNVDGVHPHDVASILSEEGVAIRSGHHCAQPLMKVLGITAACRVSFGVYNTREEVDRLMEGIEKVERIFRLKSAGPVTTFLPASARSSKISTDFERKAKLRAVGFPPSRATR